MLGIRGVTYVLHDVTRGLLLSKKTISVMFGEPWTAAVSEKVILTREVSFLSSASSTWSSLIVILERRVASSELQLGVLLEVRIKSYTSEGLNIYKEGTYRLVIYKESRYKKGFKMSRGNNMTVVRRKISARLS